jgi:hypothetical protein
VMATSSQMPREAGRQRCAAASERPCSPVPRSKSPVRPPTSRWPPNKPRGAAAKIASAIDDFPATAAGPPGERCGEQNAEKAPNELRNRSSILAPVRTYSRPIDPSNATASDLLEAIQRNRIVSITDTDTEKCALKQTLRYAQSYSKHFSVAPANCSTLSCR